MAHLVSDYLLQPDNLVEWKKHSRWGLSIHAIIHFIFTTLVLYVYCGSILVAYLALLIAGFHYMIDLVKIVHDRRHTGFKLSYWIDQLAHYFSLVAVTAIAWSYDGVFIHRVIDVNSYFDLIFFNPFLVSYFCLAIFVTLTIEFSKHHFKKSTRGNLALLNKKNMIKRLLMVTIVYVGLLFALVPSVGLNFGS